MMMLCYAVFVIFITFGSAQQYVGPVYQGQSNTQKRVELAGAAFSDRNSSSFPSIGLIELFLEDMDVSFDTVADDMPTQFLGLQRRPKLIHSVGVVAVSQWVPISNSMGYTGVFAGCQNLLIRFSLAKAPNPPPRGYAPGIAVKCLRSGVKSANLFAMVSLEGQDSWNFFKHDLTNHVPDLGPNADSTLFRLKDKFSEASDWPVFIGLSDFAKYDESGRNYSIPKFPFRLIFHPVTSVRNSFSDAPTAAPFQTVLAQKLQLGPVYWVYAQDQPTDTQDKFVLIGRIDLTTPASTSLFGDKYLFFQHSRMENDFSYKPSWVPYAQQIVDQQQNTDHYTYPDLPFN